MHNYIIHNLNYNNKIIKNGDKSSICRLFLWKVREKGRLTYVYHVIIKVRKI
jgi:hypothetical protein